MLMVDSALMQEVCCGRQRQKVGSMLRQAMCEGGQCDAVSSVVGSEVL